MRWKAFFPVLIGFCLAVVFAAEGLGAEDVQGMLTEREQGMRTEHSGASAKEKPSSPTPFGLSLGPD